MNDGKQFCTIQKKPLSLWTNPKDISMVLKFQVMDMTKNKHK
jgi:hypothetical protein